MEHRKIDEGKSTGKYFLTKIGKLLLLWTICQKVRILKIFIKEI